MVHLRHALMSDRNYQWDHDVDSSEVTWRWCLRWSDDSAQGLVLLSADFSVAGKVHSESQQVEAISCRPMGASLEYYFRDLGLQDASRP